MESIVEDWQCRGGGELSIGVCGFNSVQWNSRSGFGVD